MDFRTSEERENDRRKKSADEYQERERLRQERDEYKRRFEQLQREVVERQNAAAQKLREAEETHTRTLDAIAALRAHFDRETARNEEMMHSLQALFGSFTEAQTNFMALPTQTAGSDSNVGEMLSLLKMLAKEDGQPLE